MCKPYLEKILIINITCNQINYTIKWLVIQQQMGKLVKYIDKRSIIEQSTIQDKILLTLYNGYNPYFISRCPSFKLINTKYHVHGNK